MSEVQHEITDSKETALKTLQNALIQNLEIKAGYLKETDDKIIFQCQAVQDGIIHAPESIRRAVAHDLMQHIENAIDVLNDHHELDRIKQSMDLLHSILPESELTRILQKELEILLQSREKLLACLKATENVAMAPDDAYLVHRLSLVLKGYDISTLYEVIKNLIHRISE